MASPPLIPIAIYTVAAAMAVFFISYYTVIDDKRKILFNTAILFVLSVLLAYSNYNAGMDTQRQQDRMEGKIDINNIIERIDIQIDKRTQILVLKNNSLTDSVHGLTQKVNTIASIIHKETKEEIEENTLSGKLQIGGRLKNTDMVKYIFCSNTEGEISGKMEERPFSALSGIMPGRYNPVRISIKKNRIVLNTIIYDIYGNVVVEFKDNYWHRNRNSSGKFNYDNNGFEIFDNQGNIVFNINFISKKVVEVQGYFILKYQHKMYSGGDKGYYGAIPWQGKPDIDNETLRYGLSQVTASQLFRYTGKNWLHARLKKSKQNIPDKSPANEINM